MHQYKTNPTGPEKYIRTKGIKVSPRDILYFTASLDTQDPKKRFNAKKWIQKANKKLSVENIVYKLSKLKYNPKISSSESSKIIDW